MIKNLLKILILMFLLYACNKWNSKDLKTDNELVNDSLFIPSDSSQFYFPLEAFRDTSIYVGHDTFVNTWYSKHLFAMGEPIIFLDTSQKEIYRFTWLRTFHNPITIRIEKEGIKYMVFWKLCNGAGGYEPGKLMINKQKEIDKTIWDEFQNHINQIDFWHLLTNDNDFGEDGSQWILEGKNINHYHVVDRWTPNVESYYYQCCDFLIRLTDIESKDKY